MSTLSLNNIAPITLVLSATPQAAPSFNSGLVLTHDASIPGAGRVQTFMTSAAVAAAFAADTVLQQFAATYFSQTPTPASLMVGVHATADTTYTAAIAACADANPAFYGVACVSDTSAADQMLVAAWVEANGRRFFFCTQEAACISPPDTTSMLHTANAANYSRSMGIYSDAASDAHATIHAAVMAFYMTTQYDQPNSLKTSLMAVLTGVSGATVTQTQFNAICGTTDGATPGLNGNVYATFGSALMLQRGQAFGGTGVNGRFVDEGLALDWLVANMQVDYINLLTSQRVPATDKGSALLVNAPKKTLDKAVRNGLAAPGVWGFPGFGELDQGDFVSAGYYSYAQPITSLTTADRAARKAPAISTAIVGAGALQYLAPTIIFQR
jgi:hypothetical protein